jgi:hypothetical protein
MKNKDQLLGGDLSNIFKKSLSVKLKNGYKIFPEKTKSPVKTEEKWRLGKAQF